MALHPHADLLSDTIANDMRWKFCNRYPYLWNEAVRQNERVGNDKLQVYVDIGANIGSCVMEMVLSTNATIIAFEPNPKNRLCLIQTLSKLEPDLQKRIVVVPVALGEQEGTSEIFSASNNLGNSVVGTIIKDTPGQKFDTKSSLIDVVRLDSIFRDDAGESMKIPLMKMDVQGFECHVMGGASKSLMDTVDQLIFEYFPRWLTVQGCSDLLTRVRKFGYKIYNGDTLVDPATESLRNDADLLAKH